MAKLVLLLDSEIREIAKRNPNPVNAINEALQLQTNRYSRLASGMGSTDYSQFVTKQIVKKLAGK